MMSIIFLYQYLPINTMNGQVPIQEIQQQDLRSEKHQLSRNPDPVRPESPKVEFQSSVSKLYDSIKDNQNQSKNACFGSQIQKKSQADNCQKVDQSQQKSDEISRKSSRQELSGNLQTPSKPNNKEQKYKRSTNNSHKKFISIARRWTFKNSAQELKPAFQQKFHTYKSTRTYFFILMAYIKTVMPEILQNQFKIHYQREVKKKIGQYQKQVNATTNQNLKSFRSDEIIDLKFSIKAFYAYFMEDSLQKAIQCVYKKDKETIVKKQHYEQALKTVKKVQMQFGDKQAIQNMIQKYRINGKKSAKSKQTPSKLSESKKIKQQVSKSKTSGGFCSNSFLTPEMFGLEKGLGLIFESKSKEKSTILDEKRQNDINSQAKIQNQELIFKELKANSLQQSHKFSSNHQENFMIIQPKQQFMIPELIFSTLSENQPKGESCSFRLYSTPSKSNS